MEVLGLEVEFEFNVSWTSAMCMNSSSNSRRLCSVKVLAPALGMTLSPDDVLSSAGQMMVIIRQCLEANGRAKAALDESTQRLCVLLWCAH